MIKISLKIRSLACILIGCLLPFCTLAQSKQFRYKADVGKVDSSGVYKIELQSGFTAKSIGKGLYDIRVMDDRGKFVAYAIVTDQSSKNPDIFVSFPEVKQTVLNDTATIFIADAGSKYFINELWLKLKNTVVSRTANLSGSDDLQHWFAIKEDVELQGAGDSNDPEYEQMLCFPKSNYRYFRVQVSNKNKDPIKIVRAGAYYSSDAIVMPRLIVLPPTKINTKNSNKRTSYFVNLDDNYQVDAIQLKITSPKYYSRHILLYDVGHRTEEVLYDGNISSSESQRIFLVSTKTNKLRIDAINGDDSPLIIKDVIAFQNAQFAVSYLEKGHKYYMLTGDTSANEVSYDLTFLHSKPLSQFPVISHSAVYKNPAFASFRVTVKRDYTSAIWGAIIVVLLILSLLTWRMVKEIGAK